MINHKEKKPKTEKKDAKVMPRASSILPTHLRENNKHRVILDIRKTLQR